MTSLILSTATRYLLPLLLLFSLFLLLRGHYEPGGGFVGGLVASAAFSLGVIGMGLDHARRLLWVSPLTWIGMGLGSAVLAAVIPLLIGSPLLTGVWPALTLPVIDMIGTPLLFDVGVYALVVGVVTMIIFELAEE